MHGSKVPEWIIEAVQKCKSDDERACEIVRRFLDLHERIYAQVRATLLSGFPITIIVTAVSVFGKLPLIASVLLLSICGIYIMCMFLELRRTKDILMQIYNMFIDPHMDERYLIIGAITIIAMSIITLIVAYLLHIIPLA